MSMPTLLPDAAHPLHPHFDHDTARPEAHATFGEAPAVLAREARSSPLAPRLRALKRPVLGVALRARPIRRRSPPARATACWTSWRKVRGRRTRPSPRPRERPRRGSKRRSSSRVMEKIFGRRAVGARRLQPAPTKGTIGQRLRQKVPAGALPMVPLWHPKKQCADNHLAANGWREHGSLYLAITKPTADPIPDYDHLRRLRSRTGCSTCQHAAESLHPKRHRDGKTTPDFLRLM